MGKKVLTGERKFKIKLHNHKMFRIRTQSVYQDELMNDIYLNIGDQDESVYLHANHVLEVHLLMYVLNYWIFM